MMKRTMLTMVKWMKRDCEMIQMKGSFSVTNFPWLLLLGTESYPNHTLDDFFFDEFILL